MALILMLTFVATVAVGGGWGQNGGYGPLTAQYGLGVDQWLEALVVTPDGELRVANSEVNS
jgi:FAD/FMN-containing dehydrogenase